MVLVLSLGFPFMSGPLSVLTLAVLLSLVPSKSNVSSYFPLSTLGSLPVPADSSRLLLYAALIWKLSYLNYFVHIFFSFLLLSLPFCVFS